MFTSFADPLITTAKSCDVNALMKAYVQSVELGTDKRGWLCTFCGKTSQMKAVILNHIEAKHFLTEGHLCVTCQGTFKTKNSLAKHRSIYHRKSKS
jgi:hypothetical protein